MRNEKICILSHSEGKHHSSIRNISFLWHSISPGNLSCAKEHNPLRSKSDAAEEKMLC